MTESSSSPSDKALSSATSLAGKAFLALLRQARESILNTNLLKRVTAFIFLSLALVGCNKTSAQWNYAIELTIQTPDGLKTGRVVRTNAIAMHGGFITQPGGSQKITGEALALEIMPGQWIFGLVNESGFPIRYADVERQAKSDRGTSLMMHWYEDRPEGYGRDIAINPQTIYEQVPEGATREEERAIQTRNDQRLEQAPRETYPGTLVTFTDISDPSTIQLVDLADLEATFGEGVRFVSGRYEFTKSPRTEGVITTDWLPWLGSGDYFYVRERVGSHNGQDAYKTIFKAESKYFDTEIFKRTR